MSTLHWGCDNDAGAVQNVRCAGPSQLPEKASALFYLVRCSQAVCTYVDMLVATNGMDLGTYDRPDFALRSMV